MELIQTRYNGLCHPPPPFPLAAFARFIIWYLHSPETQLLFLVSTVFHSFSFHGCTRTDRRSAHIL